MLRRSYLYPLPVCPRQNQHQLCTLLTLGCTREVQYKKRIKKWKLEKNVKKDVMELMIKKREKRKVEEDKDTQFSINGHQVSEERLERFKKRFKQPVVAPCPSAAASPPCKSFLPILS